MKARTSGGGREAALSGEAEGEVGTALGNAPSEMLGAFLRVAGGEDGGGICGSGSEVGWSEGAGDGNVDGDGGGLEGVACEVEVNLGAGGGGGGEVFAEVDAEGPFRSEVLSEGGGDGLVTGKARVIAAAA